MSSWPDVVVIEPYSAGLAVMRRMTRAGARVTAIAEPGHSFEARSRRVRPFVRSFGEGGEPWLAALEEVAATCEQAVVLPATDRSCQLLIDWGHRLPANLRMFERSGRGHRALMDKTTADPIARRAGVRVPYTRAITRVEEIGDAVAHAPWPCVVKPIFSHEWRARYGERRVFIARGDEEVAALVDRPLRDGIGMLLSQYIPGGDDAVEEAIVVRLADGSYPVRFGCHKLRQYPPGFGLTTLGESSELPETMEVAQRVLDAADYVGIAGVETKRHELTGERWFIEVNVRIPAQWGLGDACGVEASTRMVAALAGRELPPQPPLGPGVRFLVPDMDVQVCRELLRETPLARRPVLAGRLLRPYLGAREVGLLDPRDPMPGLAWLASIVSRRLGRLRAVLERRLRLRTPSGRPGSSDPRSPG